MKSKLIWAILILLILNLLYLSTGGIYSISMQPNGALRINKYTGKSWVLSRGTGKWVSIRESE